MHNRSQRQKCIHMSINKPKYNHTYTRNINIVLLHRHLEEINFNNMYALDTNTHIDTFAYDTYMVAVPTNIFSVITLIVFIQFHIMNSTGFNDAQNYNGISCSFILVHHLVPYSTVSCIVLMRQTNSDHLRLTFFNV